MQKINEMIERAEEERRSKQPELPLLRLVVTYAGPWAHMQPINSCRIGARFSDKVANSQDMIVTKKALDPNRVRQERNIHAINSVLENASSDTFDDVVSFLFLTDLDEKLRAPANRSVVIAVNCQRQFFFAPTICTLFEPCQPGHVLSLSLSRTS